MMKKIILYVFLAGVTCSLKAQNQPGDSTALHHYYAQLQQTAQTADPQKKYQIHLFIELLKPLVYIDSLPERFTKYDPVYFTKNNNKAYEYWLAYNISLLNALDEEGAVPVRVDIDDSTLLMNHEYLTQNDLFKHYRRENNLIVIRMADEYKPALTAFKKMNQQLIQEKSKKYALKLVAVRQQYQNKFMLGYRDRNILSFFAEGYIQGKVNKKTHQKDDLLKPPTKLALIALAPPILAVSSNSLSNIQNNSSLYTLVPVLGVDWYTDNTFKKYIGLSIFHASPLNDMAGLFDNSMAGVEIHYKNKVNIGYGMSYKEIGNERISKVFISYALFSRFMKKN